VKGREGTGEGRSEGGEEWVVGRGGEGRGGEGRSHGLRSPPP